MGSLITRQLPMKQIMLCMLLVIELGPTVKVVTGEVYKVGGSAGWTANSNFDYKNWASSKTFHVKDVILFVYNATNDNVIEVTHSDYRSCNTSAPLRTFSSGNDSFTIKWHGHFFFTSNLSGHCQAGQKVDVRVLKSSHQAATPPPCPATSPSPNPSPSNVESKTLAPSPSDENSAATHHSKWVLTSIASLTLSALVVIVQGFA